MRFAAIFTFTAVVLSGFVAAAPVPSGEVEDALKLRDIENLMARGGHGDNCQADSDCDGTLTCVHGKCGQTVVHKNGKGGKGGKAHD